MNENITGEQPDNNIVKGSSLGKFANAGTLKQAYDNLEKEFTRKSQLLSDFQKQAETSVGDAEVLKANTNSNDKANQTLFTNQISMDNQDEKLKSISNTNDTNEANFLQMKDKNNLSQNMRGNSVLQNTQEISQHSKVKSEDAPYWEREDWNKQVQDFLIENPLAKQYAKEISKMVMEDKALLKSSRPLYSAWAKWLQNNYKTPEQLLDDEKFLSQVQKNDKVKRGIIKDYLAEISNRQITPPLFANSDGGGVANGKKQSPQTLDEVREMAKKIFSK